MQKCCHCIIMGDYYIIWFLGWKGRRLHTKLTLRNLEVKTCIKINLIYQNKRIYPNVLI